MNTIKFLIVALASIAISLTGGLVLMQYAHGQNMTQQQREAVVNYCFQHADRPNPIQDLIDKGFLPSDFKETCISVKQAYDKEQTIINNNLEIERHNQQVKQQAFLREEDKSSPYASCLLNTDTTFEECFRMFAGIK